LPSILVSSIGEAKDTVSEYATGRAVDLRVDLRHEISN
jgi:hypothetical protein